MTTSAAILATSANLPVWGFFRVFNAEASVFPLNALNLKNRSINVGTVVSATVSRLITVSSVRTRMSHLNRSQNNI